MLRREQQAVVLTSGFGSSTMAARSCICAASVLMLHRARNCLRMAPQTSRLVLTPILVR